MPLHGLELVGVGRVTSRPPRVRLLRIGERRAIDVQLSMTDVTEMVVKPECCRGMDGVFGRLEQNRQARFRGGAAAGLRHSGKHLRTCACGPFPFAKRLLRMPTCVGIKIRRFGLVPALIIGLNSTPPSDLQLN